MKQFNYKKKKGKTMDAVCSVCQRLIKNGVTYLGDKNEMVVKFHPAVSVFIDVRKSGWEREFDMKDHCEGSWSTPETVLR